MDLNYTVKEGDTVTKIAADNNTTAEEVVRNNKLRDSNYVQVGQVLKFVAEENSYEAQANATAAEIAADKRAADKIAAESSEVQPEQVVTNSLLSNPVKEPSKLARGFYEVLRNSETDHGSTPKPTNDRAEGGLSAKERSLDVGFGHKVQESELASGTIHGIPFKNLKTGAYIPLTDSQKLTIQKKDIEANVKLARKTSWDATLKSIGMSYESLAEPYRLVLEDIAYNVGGEKAGLEWKGIFSSMKKGDTRGIVGHLRRKDNKKNTPGMDNRAAKSAYAAGLINTLQEAKDAGLSLADTKEIPLR